MGASQSKEELLYQGVQYGNHDVVKSLRRDGASLEWVDKKGRTPLTLACTRGELLDMAITLLNLGANMNAYRPGTHGGFPLHHAAKKGLEKTVTLLLSRGADPLAVNDDSQTPLDMARSRGHVSVVRLLEEQMCLFSAMLREHSGLGILGTIAPSLATNKIWVVVLPAHSHTTSVPKYDIAIYESPKVSLWNGVRPASAHPAGLCNVPQPRTTISLEKAEIEEPQFNCPDPVLCIRDKIHKTQYKFLPEKKGDKIQLEKFYETCRGICQVQSGIVPVNNNNLLAAGYQQGKSSQIHPIRSQQSGAPFACRQPVLQAVSVPSSSISESDELNHSRAESVSEELAMALALDASIQTAAEEGIPLSSVESNDYSTGREYQGWKPPDLKKQRKRQKKRYVRWRGDQNTYNGWDPAETGLDSPQCVPNNKETTATLVASPSAPPLLNGQIHHLSVKPGCSIGQAVPNTNMRADDKVGGACVICWDAYAEGACIPCGHLAGCMNCLSEIKSMNWGCPVCRGQIDQVVRVYAV